MIIVFLSLSISGYSTVYYVSSSTGSDENSGTSENSAWRSLEKVNSFTPKPGDQILFKRGDSWVGTITVNASGTSGSPIVYGAYGTGDKPKIYGSEVITGWTRHSGNIYKATVTGEITQLFVDDERVRVARYPDEGYLYIDKTISPTSFTYENLRYAIDYSGAKCHVRTRQWILSTKNVIESSSQTLVLDSEPTYGFSSGKAFFLNNKLEFLTREGEWYLDINSKTVYLWTPAGDSPVNHSVRGSKIDNGVYLESKDFLTIRDLSLEHSKKSALYANKSDYLVIENCSVKNPDLKGFDIKRGYYNVVRSNYVTGAMDDAISYSKTYLDSNNSGLVIEGNEVVNTGVFDAIGLTGIGSSNGIISRAENAIIRYNRIVNTGYTGIQFYGKNTQVEFNFIDNYCTTLNDGGGIYNWVGVSGTVPNSINSKGSVIRQNIVINGNGDGTGYLENHNNQSGVYAMYLDEASEGIYIEGNTIASSSGHALFLHETIDIEAVNNIIFDNPKGVRITHDDNFSRGNRITNNIVCNISTSTDWYLTKTLTPQLVVTNKPLSDFVLDNNVYIDRHRNSVFRRTDTFEFLTFEKWQAASKKDNNSAFISDGLVYGEAEELFFNDSKEEKKYFVNDATAKDIYGNSITTSFTLQPFASKIIVGTKLSSIQEFDSSSDNVPPTITSFVVPAESSSKNIVVNSFEAIDNIGVKGYLLTGTSAIPDVNDSGWTTVAPDSYTFSATGLVTLYAWAKDAAGNISNSVSKQVSISLSSGGGNGTFGNTEVYAQLSYNSNRRAQPVIFTESGTIESISVYHNGGSGNVLLGVYSDDNGSPGTLQGITSTTAVNSTEGWQTVRLLNPVSAASGATVWLSWVFEKSPGVRYSVGSPSRAHSLESWSSGMPDSFGYSSFADYKYSVYCTYSTEEAPSVTSNNAGNTEVYAQLSYNSNRRAQPVIFTESGTIENISVYHNGGSGNVLLGVYSDDNGSPGTLQGITSTTAVNSTEGWQTVRLLNPVSAASGATVWLSWVFEKSPGVRYSVGSPSRAHSLESWSSGMPDSFGYSSFADYKYSVYCTYVSIANVLKEATIPESEKGENAFLEIIENSGSASEFDDFDLYPNPARSFVNVRLKYIPEIKSRILLVDASGKILSNYMVSSGSVKLDVAQLSSGLYFVKVVNAEMSITKKLIILNDNPF
ncbi:T9SS type A sorting domain-containing protein [Mariniphaga anaerophila]|nr:T9SS type A sorting domain-containing protein [Mariniphaga anaerophila]